MIIPTLRRRPARVARRAALAAAGSRSCRANPNLKSCARRRAARAPGPGHIHHRVASAGETHRDLAGRQFPRNCLPYRVLHIVNLKIYNVSS